MSVAFLTPDGASTRALHARSPMERAAVAAGARLSRVEGWNVPNAYDEPTREHARLTRSVGFVDRSSLAKLELHADPRTLAQVLARVSDGQRLEPGMAGRFVVGAPTAAVWWCPLTPARALLLCEPDGASALRQALAGPPDGVGVVDVTCGLAGLSLVGPQARELLARFCAIDVRPAVAAPTSFRPVSVARTPGYVLVEAPDRLLVLVGWALGEYLWQVVADAAAQLGGGPVGAEALSNHLQQLETLDA